MNDNVEVTVIVFIRFDEVIAPPRVFRDFALLCPSGCGKHSAKQKNQSILQIDAASFEWKIRMVCFHGLRYLISDIQFFYF